MIDLNKIGQRIKEQRKYILHISQEKMAEDLNLYQADISNLEKAKSGSGISDLTRLDLIADFFHKPLETLLFGVDGRNFPGYPGQMVLKRSRRQMLKSHVQTLQKLTGIEDPTAAAPVTCECGPYTLHSLTERQILLSGKRFTDDSLNKLHTYVFVGSELLAVMTADVTSLMQHVFQPSLGQLQTLIQPDVLDVTDVWRTLNPYWALYCFPADDAEAQENMERMLTRCDELRAAGEQRPILYIESVYVREDSRRHGIFRMYIDFLKLIYDGCILWLNMEPTSGSELEREYDFLPCYTVSELGQLNMNAAIAEKVGFTVDPDTWHRQAEIMDADGDLSVQTVLIRKCAYWLPGDVRELLQHDGDLVADGRARQRIAQADEPASGGVTDLFTGTFGEEKCVEIKETLPDGGCAYAAALIGPTGIRRYVVSHFDIPRTAQPRLIAAYTSLEEAADSDYADTLQLADLCLSSLSTDTAPQ